MPNPMLNYDYTYWCDLLLCDIEPDDNPCVHVESKGYRYCGECPQCQKQNYTITTKDERYKEFI